jgi:hypothetical protein
MTRSKHAQAAEVAADVCTHLRSIRGGFHQLARTHVARLRNMRNRPVGMGALLCWPPSEESEDFQFTPSRLLNDRINRCV